MLNFRDALERCSLSDLGHVGDPLMWSNKHDDATFIKERLDRAIAK